jgi:hypothetical protein
MSRNPLSGCLSQKEITQLNTRLNELSFELGDVLDQAFYKILTAEFNICDAADIPADTGGVQQFLCITDGVCTFLDKSDVVELNQTVTSISFDAATNIVTYVDEAGVNQPLDLSSLVSNPETVTTFVHDTVSNTITYVSEDGTTTVVPLAVEEPNCFYVDGDKTQSSAANKICDAIDNGKAIAFTDGAGNVDQILNPATQADVEAYLTAQGATGVDTTNWTFNTADKIGVCCEEEVCGLQPVVNQSPNNARMVDAAAGVTTLYRPGSPYQLTTTVTNLDGTTKAVFGSGAFNGSGIVTTNIPAFTTFEDATVTTVNGEVCEPSCIEYSYSIFDIDISSSFTVLNPADITSVVPSADNVNGSWAQDPLDPNTWIFTQLNPNSNANIRFFANCDKPIIVQFQTDFVGQQFRQTMQRAAKLKYVCDPSVNSNRISAEGPNGTSPNPNTITIP